MTSTRRGGRHGRRATALLLTLCIGAIACLAGCVTSASSTGSDRLKLIRWRGFLTCGLAPHMPGFSVVDTNGFAIGFDADLCRAVAAVLLGSADAVRFRAIDTVTDFLATDDIDMAFHGLTWKWAREVRWGVTFGPVTYFDGQAFLVFASDQRRSIRDIRGPICVRADAALVGNLRHYFEELGLELRVIAIAGLEATRAAFLAGRCEAWSGDASTLGASVAGADARRFRILPERISNEPLAPIFRQADRHLQDVVRWTIYALIAAEAWDVKLANLDHLPDDHPGKSLLRVAPSAELGLDERWAYRAVASRGNYGELYEQNFGGRDWPEHDRGQNDSWRHGGLMYAPPFSH